ncbi:hypothetical protein RhiirA4_483093 [Rhizophagus irregularis]|uniref:Uncharacterized protein n=1 Tax=Rhizophagus irregularis TaxID=588596 RepID=A0A2I1HM42_9GLOM|nr:hypothetical protein RhiirA4_483093 [Rhizophagus irregularis]
MPVAISIQELRKSTIEHLKAKHDEEKFSTISVPSSEWIRLQFWPKNIYTKTAIQYSGRFNISYKVQSRLLRKSHPEYITDSNIILIMEFGSYSIYAASNTKLILVGPFSEYHFSEYTFFQIQFSECLFPEIDHFLRLHFTECQFPESQFLELYETSNFPNSFILNYFIPNSNIMNPDILNRHFTEFNIILYNFTS